MKQALHIFWKDTRTHIAEISATLFITAMFVWVYPMSWSDVPSVALWPWVPSTITALLPVSWLVLITRVIHSEALVGERHFWLTRPYRWPQLLAAKSIFILTFVYLPFFIAQLLFLRAAAFHPSSHLVGILYNLATLTGIAILPMACLASVTGTFPRMLLALLSLLLFVAAVAYANSLLPTSNTSNSLGDILTFLGAVSVFLAVLIIQYARRWTALTRGLLIALGLVIAIVGLFGPEDFCVRRMYPERAGEPPLAVSFRETEAVQGASLANSVDEREFTIDFPLSISGIAGGTAVKVDNARVSFSAADGDRWSSHWQEAYGNWNSGDMESTVGLKINRAAYARLKDKPVSVTLDLAFTLLKGGPVKRMLIPGGSFELPGGTLCRLSPAWWTGFRCLSPLRQPPLMRMTTRFTKKDCSLEPPQNDGSEGVAWIGTLVSDPADVGLTSVWETPMYFQRPPSPGLTLREHLCPGSPLAVSQYAVETRWQQTVQSKPLDLKALVLTKLQTSD